jgi:predicted amidohydrolase
MPPLKVAAAQIECIPSDIDANLTKHLATIWEAREAGANLVIFPELSLTDYLAAPDTRILGRDIGAEEISQIADAAGSMTVSFGFIERGDEGRFHNSTAIVSAGSLLHVHRKLNLPTYGQLQEGLHYTAGDALELATIAEGWQAATLICADSWNPAIAWLAAIKQPDLLIQPIASARGAVGGEFDNPANWTINLQHTAMTYGLPLVMCNHCGSRGGAEFWGGSRILDAFGRELARAGEGEATIYAEIELNDAHTARSLLPTIRDADPQLVQAILGAILRPR